MVLDTGSDQLVHNLLGARGRLVVGVLVKLDDLLELKSLESCGGGSKLGGDEHAPVSFVGECRVEASSHDGRLTPDGRLIRLVGQDVAVSNDTFGGTCWAEEPAHHSPIPRAVGAELAAVFLQTLLRHHVGVDGPASQDVGGLLAVELDAETFDRAPLLGVLRD